MSAKKGKEKKNNVKKSRNNSRKITRGISRDLFVHVIDGLPQDKLEVYCEYLIDNYYDEYPQITVKSLADFAKTCQKKSDKYPFPVYVYKNMAEGLCKYKKNVYIKPLPSVKEALKKAESGSAGHDFEKDFDEINDLVAKLAELSTKEVDQKNEETEVADTVAGTEAKAGTDTEVSIEDSTDNTDAPESQKQGAEKYVEDIHEKLDALKTLFSANQKSVSNSAETKKQLEEKEKECLKLKESNGKLTGDLKTANGTIKSQSDEIVSLNGELNKAKEANAAFNEKAYVLKDDVWQVIKEAYELQKDIDEVISRANKISSKYLLKGSMESELNKMLAKAIAKFNSSVAARKNYAKIEKELPSVAYKGIIFKGTYLYDTFAKNIDDKNASWINILFSEFYQYNVGAAIVLCEDFCVRIPKYFGENVSAEEFAKLSESIRTKATKLGFKIDTAKPFAMVLGNTEDWGVQEFESGPIAKDLKSGQISEVMQLAVNYGNTNNKTKVISKE